MFMSCQQIPRHLLKIELTLCGERCGTEAVRVKCNVVQCRKRNFLQHLWSGSHTGVVAFPLHIVQQVYPLQKKVFPYIFSFYFTSQRRSHVRICKLQIYFQDEETDATENKDDTISERFNNCGGGFNNGGLNNGGFNNGGFNNGGFNPFDWKVRSGLH